MPFIQQIPFDKGVAGIWEIIEAPDQLFEKAQLSEQDVVQYSKITSQKRKTEFLVTRILVEKITGKNYQIVYEPDGNPTLPHSKKFISISHSASMVVVYISEQNCGVDVETLDRDTDRIAKRFLHPDELEIIQNKGQSKTLQLLYWCAKEAIFKCSPQQGVQFSEQIKIFPFNPNQTSQFTGSLTTESKTEFFKLWFMTLKNNMLVFCVEMGKNEQ